MLRSGWLSFTQSSPRRALARQLTRFSGSPGANCRMSANSIPSPFRRDTSLPGEDLGLARLQHRGAAPPRADTRAAAAASPAAASQTSKPERIARARVGGAEHVPAPARGAQRELELAPLAGAQAQRHRVRARRASSTPSGSRR